MLVSMLLGQFTPALTWANPVGEQVVSGQAGFQRDGSTLTISQGTQNVIINWQDFSIAAGEVTRFIQPNDLAAALNRVITNNPSGIYGLLEANGQVLLINQSGILVGPGARIDTAGFIASTLDVSDQAFLAGGDLTFVGDSKAAIQNLGSINARSGDVYLIAQQIDNSGTIAAGNGTAGLAAGSEILLKAAGDDRVSVRVGSAGPLQEGAAITNSGEVEAARVTMEATGSMYAVAVNNEGVARATGADTSGGRVRLTAGGADISNSGTISARDAGGDGGTIRISAGSNADGTATVVSSGTLDASGEGAGTTGGRVEVTGDRVALTGAAVVDVSGDGGGGAAYIGGGWQGKDPEIRNAQQAHVGSGVTIDAGAGTSGDGGTVVVWSDENTWFNGTISARGGSTGGDGGSVETSGKAVLNVGANATVDAGAAAGAAGEWLLDPTNVTISNAANANGTFDGGDPDTWTPSATGSNVDTNVIVATLEGGTNVTITTNDDAGVDGGEAGDITVVDVIDVTTTAGDVTLRLHADNDIFVNNDILQSGGADSLSLELFAADDISVSGAITLLGGDATLTADAANLDGDAANGGDGLGTINIIDAITTNGGAIAMTTGASAGQVLTIGAGGTISSGGGTITISAADLDVSDAINAGAGSISITQNTAGTIGLGDTAGDLTIAGAELQNITTTGTLSLISTFGGGTAITVNNITAANSNNVGTVNLDASGGANADISFNTTASTFNALTATASDQVFVDIALSTDAGALSLIAQGDSDPNPALDINAAIVSSGAVLLRGDTIDVGNTVTAAGQTVTLRPFDNTLAIDVGGADVVNTALGLTDGELNNIDAGTIIVGNTGVTGDLTVTATIDLTGTTPNLQLTTSGAVAVNAAVTVDGNLRLQSGTGTSQTAAGDISADGLATSGAGAVTLDTATNTISNFASNTTNSVSLTTAGSVDIDAVGAISGINLGTGNALTLVSGGDITQSVLIIAGATSLDASGNITLNNANNQFGGTVDLTTTADGDVQLTNSFAGGTQFDASTIGGDFTFISTATGGGVTQIGALTLTGGTTNAASFTTQNADVDIILDDAGNVFDDTVAFSTTGTAGDVVLVNNSTLGTTFETTTVNGSLTVTQLDQSGAVITQAAASTITVTGDASFDNDTTDVGDVEVTNIFAGGTEFGPGDSVVQGDLTVVSTGAVTQTGAVKVAGDFSSTAPSTTMDQADNVFGGTFTSSDGSVFVSQVGDVDVNEAVTGTTGNAVNVTGSLTVIALQEGEEFDAGPVNVAGIILNENNSFQGGLVVNTGNPVLNTVTAASNDIFQTGDITVGGTSTFRAPETSAGLALTGDITLDGVAGNNALNGPIQFAGVNVVLDNDGAAGTNLGASTVTGTFDVTSANAITNSGVLDVTGLATFETLNADQAITLNQNNLFDDAVSFTTSGAGGDVVFNNAQATVLGDVSQTGGDFSVTSAGHLTQALGTGIDQSVGGVLNVTTTAGGNAVLTNTADNTILALNNFTSAGNFQLYEADGFNVTGTGTVTGFTELGVSTGNVTQTAGSITSNGLLLNQLNAAAATSTFSLFQAANNVGSVAATVGNAGSTSNVGYASSTSFNVGTVNAVSGIDAGIGSVRLDATGGASIDFAQNIDVGATGSMAISATGNLTQSGGVLLAGSGNIYLRAATIGTLANPILTQGVSGSAIQLSAESTGAGLFLRNQVAGDLEIDAFDPAGFLDSSTALGLISGIDAATALVLENDAPAADGGGINIGTAATISAGGNATIDHTDAFTQTDATTALLVGGTLTLTGDGAIGVGGGQAVETNAAVVVFNKGNGNTALETTGGVTVTGTLGGGADLHLLSAAGNIIIGNADLSAATSGSIFDIQAASGNIESATATAFVNMAGGDLMLRGSQIGASGVDFQIRNVDRFAANATAGQLNVDHAYTAASTDATVFVGSVTGHSGATVNGLQAATNITFDQVAENRIQVENTGAANDIFSNAGNIDLIVAQSASGPDQLIIDSGVVIRSGAGAGGTINIFGGVNNNGSVQSGTVITLDGGRPDLTLAGAQSYNGDVTFSATQDIVVTGTITQNAATGVTTFIADSDDDGAGGFILTDSAGAGFIVSVGGNAASNISIEGSELVGTYSGAGNTYTGLTDRGIVIANAALGNAIQMGNAGQVTLVTKDPVGGSQHSIIVDGGISVGTGASASLSLQSDFGIAMSRNMSVGAGGVASIQNEGAFIRTNPATARLSVGNSITFTGGGDIGTDGVVANALLDLTSQGDVQTAGGLMIFDATKSGSEAYISELDGVAIEGSLDLLDLTAGGSIADTVNTLDINLARMTASTGSIILDTGHNIAEFNGVHALLGGFTYIGLENLVLSDVVEVSATGAGTINISVDGFDLEQQAGATIAGNVVNLTMSTGELNAFIRDAVASTAQNSSVTIETTGAGVVLTTSGASSRISTDDLTVLGTGSVGNDLSDGLYTDADNLIFSKDSGDLFVFEDNTVAGNVSTNLDVVGDIGLITGGTLNVSSRGATGIVADIDVEGINAANGSNVHLVATTSDPAVNARINQVAGSIVMSGGDLLLVGNRGVGTKAAPILTEGTFNLAALNTGDNGGIFLFNDAGDVIVQDVQAFTPGSPTVLQTFNGVFQASTGNSGATTGLRNIRIQNDGGDIRIGDRIQTTVNNQQVLLVANQADGQILQEDADGVINMAGGQLYLQADSGIGLVDDALRTSGTFSLAANSSDDSGGNTGGVYLVNVGTATQANAISASGTVTISAFGESGGGLGTISGVTTDSPGADADIRIRNTAGATSNIVVDNVVQASTNDGGNSVILVADNGAILQGSSGNGLIIADDGALEAEILLAASQGIGTLAAPLRTRGNYDIAFLNDALFFTTGAVTGNVSIRNMAVGPFSGLGDMTVTDNVADVFSGAGINAAVTIVDGGLNAGEGAGSGAIVLTNDAAGADTGDIIIVDTTLRTTGTVGNDAFITLDAEDDVLIGDAAQAEVTEVSTQNGAINLISGNANLSPTDNFNGVFITASDAGSFNTVVDAGGAGGAVNVTATANAGILRVEGGDAASADVTLHSDANMTVLANTVEVQGGAGADSFALVESLGTQTIGTAVSNITNYVAVLGGTGEAADAVIASTGNQSLFIAGTSTFTTAPFTDAALALNGGTDATDGGDAVVTSLARQLIDIADGNLEIIGGTGVDADAGLAADGVDGGVNLEAQRILLDAGNLIVQAGAGADSDGAIVQANAGAASQYIEVAGAIDVRGGAGDGGLASIASLGGTAQTITLDAAGDFRIIGGDGLGAEAFVLGEGDTQDITVSDGQLLVQANQDATNGLGSAYILSQNNADAVQTIEVTSGGITVQGGAGADETASIEMSGSTGQQSIHLITDGDLLVLGGTGEASFALITSAGLDAGAGQEAQRILIDAGRLLLSAGDATADNSDANITQTNAGAASQIIQVDDGNATGVPDGTVTLLGGDGDNEGAVISSAGTGTQAINIARGLTITGGAGAVASGAGISASGAGVAQIITVTDGDATLTGGTGSASRAFIDQTNGVGTQQILISGTDSSSDLVLLGGDGNDADARIRAFGTSQEVTVSNGNLTITANQDVTSGLGDAFILASNNGSTQTIDVDGAGAGELTLLGGAGATEIAQILGNGIQIINVANGISVTGGSGADSTASIDKAGDINDTQTITVDSGDFAILGGTGADAFAAVTSNGITQAITVSDGALTVIADQTNAATAGGNALVSLANNTGNASVQTIDVTNGGIIVQGGVGSPETATIEMLDTDGQQSIHLLTGGDLVVEGGDGAGSFALITSAGLDNGTEAQRIVIDAGQLIVQGNTDAANADGAARITQTNAGAASQVIDVNGTAPADGTVSVLGGAGTNDLALISSAGTVAQTLTIDQGLTITGGTGDTAFAGIQSDGTGQAQSVTVFTGDALITGGTNTNTDAFIIQNAATGTQVIDIQGGSALSNLALLGGNGANADAYIQANGTLQDIDVDNGSLTVTANQDATNAGSNAFIRALNNASTQLIDVNGVGAGQLTLLGGAGAPEIAQILGNGIQTIHVANGISVTGGSGAGSTASIDKAGDANDTQTITVDTGDFAILGGTGANAAASVTSNGVTQSITVSDGALTVIADQTNNATAGGNALVSLANNAGNVAVQTLLVTNGGIIVQGGVGAPETATIEMLDANGRQFIRLFDDGDLLVLGGAGDASHATITSAGLDTGTVGEEAQRIVVEAGRLFMDAGDATSANSDAVISQTNAGAASQIIRVLDGDATGAPDGTVTLLGGAGADEDALITSAGTGTQTLLADQGLAITGGDGLDSTAGIRATGATVDQVVTVTTGDALLTGGLGQNAHAFIEQTNAAGTQDININAGAAASDLTLIGGNGENADAYIAAAGTLQTVTLVDGMLTVQADQDNGANNSDAYVLADNAAADQDIDVTNGGILVQGGAGDTELAYISLAGANGTGSQTIDLNTTGDFDILGGTGLNSTASVTSTGLEQTITLDDGALSVQGDQTGGGNNGGNALISLASNTSGAAVQTIDVTNGGVLVQGGVDTDTAAISMLDPNGQQSIHVITAGDLEVLGGSGAAATALITSAGLNGATEAQRIVVDAGSLTVNGGSGDDSDAGIEQTNTGAASQYIEVAGLIDVLGGTGDSADAFIRSLGNVAQTITLDAAGDLRLIGGDGLGAEAFVLGQGDAQTITVSNGQLLVQGNQDAANAFSAAYIRSQNNADAVQTIDVTNGGITVQGGAGTDEFAQIQVTGAASAQNITTLTAGSIQVLGGTGTDAFASIEAANNQTIISVAQILLTGGSGTNSGGFAEIEALDIQSLTAATGIRVNGGSSTGADDHAVIRGAGQQTITVTAGGLVLNGNQGNTSAPIGEYDFGAGIVADTAGTQTITVNAGGLDMNGGTSAGAAAVINQAFAAQQTLNITGTTTLDGGSAAGTFALIEGSGNQTITSSQAVTLTGGTANDDDFAAIVGNNQQAITVALGGLTLNGGQGTTNATTFGEYDFGAGVISDNAGTQTITINGGGLHLNGGSGVNSAAVINQAVAAAQTLNVTGTTTLAGGSAAGTFALIEGSGVQTLTGSRALTLTGGTANNDDFAAIVGNNTQTITINSEGVTIAGGQGTTSAVTFGEYDFGAGIISDGAGTQTIDVNAVGLTLTGGSGTNSAAVINQAVAALQTIDVTGTTTLNGGSGAGAFALIEGSGVQTLTSSDAVTLTGGTANNDDFAAIVGNNTQTITVASGGLTLDGGEGTTNTVAFGEYDFGAGIVSDGAGTQTITIAAGGLDMDGGSDVNAAAVINQAVAAQQTIDVTGTTTLNGGSAAGSFALIDGSGNQAITSSGAMTLTGGTANDADFAAIVGNAEQSITVASGGLELDGNDGTTGAVALGEYSFGAGIVADGGSPQTLTVNGGLTLAGGDSTDSAAVINQAAAATQTINVTGTTSLTGGSAAGAFALIDGSGAQAITSSGAVSVTGGTGAGGDNFAGILANGTQTLTVAAGGLALVAGGGSQDALTIGVEDAGAFVVADGNQTVAVNGGNLGLTGGSRGAALIDAGGATQTVTVAAGNASLNDGTGANARINAAAAQTITTSGTTNLRGDSGNEAVISAGTTSVLNNNGGTWAGAANVVAGTSVTINNTGTITVDESSGFEGAVTTPLLVFSGGQATVGSTATGPGGSNTRLNTDVNHIVFSSVGSKTVNISENDGVSIRGTVNTLDLITDNAGDIVNGSTPFNAVNATLLTASGNIDLGGQANGVQNFRGVVANGGSFDYLGGQNVTVFGRDTSAEVPSGESIFAGNTITMDVGAGTIFLSGGSKVGGTGPGSGDGKIASGSDQLYRSNVVLLRDYQITSDGSGTPASDEIVFERRIDGPGGLTIGSTPIFNGFIGGLEPLAYLVLNSQNAFFNRPDGSTNGPYTAVMNGSFINNGTMHLSGPQGNYTFITDLGFIAAGPSVFQGGNMDLGTNTITVYTSSQDQASGSALPPAQEFESWNGAPFRPLVPFANATVFFKAPPPQGEIKEKKNLRKDDEGNILVDYAGGDMTGSGSGTAGLITRDLSASSYTIVESGAEDYFFFGFETQAPVEGLGPVQLVDDGR